MNKRRWRAAWAPLAAVGAVVLGALGLSGCMVISSSFGNQLNTVGNVQLDTTVCTSSNAAGSTCPDLGNIGASLSDGDGQALIAFRIPAATTAPATMTSTDTTVTFNLDASYGAEMQRLFPAPASQKWVGYVSQTQTFVAASGQRSVELLPEFPLPQGPNGTPFQTPFSFRAVSGFRTVAPPSTLANRPVVCGPTTADLLSDGGTTACFDSPSAAIIATDQTRSTRDLGVAVGGAVVTTVGQIAQVPFTLSYSGTSTTAANFAISAATNLPGAIVAPSLGNLNPSTNSATQAFVNVTVPLGAVSGNYAVSLTASLANGQTRSNTATIVIPVSLSFKLTTITALRARTLGVRLIVTAKNRGVVTFKAIQGGKTRVTKRIALKLGKNTVVLRSLKFKPGKYKVTVTGLSLSLTKTGRLT